MHTQPSFYTYCYIDPSRKHPRFEEGEPIYVGKGTGDRCYWHLSRKDRHPLTSRLKSMRKKGVKPLVKFLAQGIDEELAFLVEVEAIGLYGRKDLNKGPLLNLTDGGEGVAGLVLTHEALAARNAAIKSARSTPEAKARASANATRIMNRPEVKAAHILRMQGLWENEEFKRSMGNAIRAAFAANPEGRKKQNAAIKAAHARPEVRAAADAKQRETWAKPEVRARQSARLKEALASPEARATKSAAAKAWRANLQAVKCPHCDKVGSPPNMTRYHFDNCKHK